MAARRRGPGELGEAPPFPTGATSPLSFPQRATFPKSARVRKRPEYVVAQKTGARVTTPHFVLLLAPNATPEASARLGVTASRQVGNAVVRNRGKRIVREAFRLHPGFFPNGVDVVVILRAGAHALGTAAVLAEWAKVRGLLAKKADEAKRRRAGAISSSASHSPPDGPKR